MHGSFSAFHVLRSFVVLAVAVVVCRRDVHDEEGNVACLHHPKYLLLRAKDTFFGRRCGG